MTLDEKPVTDEEMVQAMKTLKNGCKQRANCDNCPLATVCDDCFGDTSSEPMFWYLEELEEQS